MTPSDAAPASSSPPHSQTTEKLLDRYGSSPNGLTEDKAQAAMLRHGQNRLPVQQRKSAVARFLLQFHNVLIYVLLGAALITALLQHWVDTAVIVAVVIINAALGYVQEGRAEKAMDAVRGMLAPMASVLRGGNRLSLRAEQLVPGDIVLLESGDRVPADLRLLKSHGLTVQEAVLTGESVPVEKNTQATQAQVPLAERTCMAYSGTLVASGQGQGLVVATGASTEIGRISALLQSVEPLATPLVRQMTSFARWLTVFILILAGLMMLYGHYVQGFAFKDLFMIVVSLSVAAIPAGLPAVLTITLAVGVQSMARRNAIVRRLPSIETIGAVSVICTDKTGTLTRNEMTVASLALHDKDFTVTGSGYVPEGEIKQGDQTVDAAALLPLRAIARIAALCNDARLHQTDASWAVEGDPMEGALLVLARKLGVTELHEQKRRPRVDTLPFDAKHRYMATLNQEPGRPGQILIKGAPEAILAICARQYAGEGSSTALDAALWRAKAEAIAAQGQRVLALAYKKARDGQQNVTMVDLGTDALLVGLVGLEDLPRQEAIDAVAECRRAGISVKMITGDHAGTAAAIGKMVGLEHPDQVLTGHDLDNMSPGQLAAAVQSTDVFARTSPEHKLQLITALQANGRVIAMTGDGVNDAPALKRADFGIAMGKKGSEAAKEAANLVLADDSVGSIVAAVREGRTVYDNLQKVIGWTLPTTAGEALTVVIALLLGATLPITPVHILWVNLITAITLGVALAFEPTEARTMLRPPRRPDAPLLNGTIIWFVVLVSLLYPAGVYAVFAFAQERGYPLELARTMAVNTLVVMEIFSLFFMRNFYSTSITLKAMAGTRAVWTTLALVTLAQFAFTYAPWLQALFGTAAVPLADGLLILGVGVLLLVILEVEKQIRLRFFGFGARAGL